MADITPTKADVISGVVRQVTLLEDVTIFGQLLMYDYTLGGYALATAGNITADARVLFMAVETGVKEVPLQIVEPGAIVDLGVVLTQGVDYALSASVGGRIAPYSDLVAGNIASFVGIAISTSQLHFYVLNSGTDV